MDINRQILEKILEDNFKGSKTALAKATGDHLSNVSRWFSTKAKPPTSRKVMNICDILELDYNELAKEILTKT